MKAMKVLVRFFRVNKDLLLPVSDKRGTAIE